MTAEGAGNKYTTPGGQFDVPHKLSHGDSDKSQPAGSDADAADTAAGHDDENDSLIDGLFETTDNSVAPTTTGAEVVATLPAKAETEEEPKLDLASRLDPTKPRALLKLFGDLIITHEATTQMPDTRADVAKAKADAGGNEDHSETYNGNEKTQEAFARVVKVVQRDSEIPDRLLQTLDRLNRQMPNSQTA